jgi:hypothetical protein
MDVLSPSTALHPILISKDWKLLRRSIMELDKRLQHLVHMQVKGGAEPELLLGEHERV